MKIILFGSTGMLGNYVNKYLSQFYDVTLIDRKAFDIETCEWGDLNNIVKLGDVIINCAGAIPQQKCDIRKYISLNTLFPHKLNEISKNHGRQFIHITTDCVFSGKNGNYNENSKHDAEDIYGISKSLGEDSSMCIIRTSIIGEEINNKNSLIEWVIKQKNNTINGYSNFFWNGVTCLQLAKIIYTIIDKKMFWNGIKHINSPDIVSKYQLCQYINDIYDLNIKINVVDYPEKNMTICSNYDNSVFNIPNIKLQIEEQKLFKTLDH
jgi:dTDP-4-dehydrorhamnose reductase